MSDHSDKAYIIVSGVSGAITGLSMMRWKDMSWSEIGMTLFVGTAFAIFAVPWIAADWLHIDIQQLRAICGLTYAGATGANVFIPVMLRKLKAQIGAGDEA